MAISSSGQAPALSGFMKEEIWNGFSIANLRPSSIGADLREQAKANEPMPRNAVRCCAKHWTVSPVGEGAVSEGLG